MDVNGQQCSLHEDPNSLAHTEVNHARGSYVYTGDFAQENFNMADKTAGKLETALRVNKVSAKAFEPRTSCILIYHFESFPIASRA